MIWTTKKNLKISLALKKYIIIYICLNEQQA